MEIKRSQPSAAPTGDCISNVGAAEGCDLLLFPINAENPLSLVVYCILHGSVKFKFYK
jgi:hypothetical protein